MTVYYDIFETEESAEYHISSIRAEVVERRSMCRRITFPGGLPCIKSDTFTATRPYVNEKKAEWLEDAEMYGCKHI